MSPLRLGCHLRTSIDDRWVQSTPPSVIVEKKKKKKKVDRSWIHILETDSIVFFVKMIHCDRLIVCGWHWQKSVCVCVCVLLSAHCMRSTLQQNIYDLCDFKGLMLSPIVANQETSRKKVLDRNFFFYNRTVTFTSLLSVKKVILTLILAQQNKRNGRLFFVNWTFSKYQTNHR